MHLASDYIHPHKGAGNAARRLRLVKVPDLNGPWSGVVHPSGRKRSYEHPATIEITQTWQSLCVQLCTEYSRSSSLIRAMIVEEAEEVVLNYEFANEPSAHASGGMHAHRGTARLVLTDGLVLQGEYYTGRDRKSHGTLRFERAPFAEGKNGRDKRSREHDPGATRMHAGDYDCASRE